MNATHTIDHLQAITHVTSLLNTGANLGGAATVSKPKTAVTRHYDPTGQEAAIASKTLYEGVTFTAGGAISGGSLIHEASVPGGNKLSTTSVVFENTGKPASAVITEHNNTGNEDFKKIQMDMSGATWNGSFAIASGQVSLTTLDATTGHKKQNGTILFSNEAITTGAFTHYNADGSEVVTSNSQVDYSGARFLGNNIVGGQYIIISQVKDKALKSSSVITVSPLGRLQSIETTNTDGDVINKMATPGAVATKVTMDFSKVVFNARDKFDSGEVTYTTSDGNGTLVSKTTLAYARANPSFSTTWVYKNGQLQNKIVVDYTASQFNNDHQVVNSNKTVEIYSGDGKLISTSIISYDATGNKIKETAQATPVNATPPGAVQQQVKTAPPSKLIAATGDGTTQKTDSKYRKDNTLEQTLVTTLKSGKPVFALITLYALDGKTVTKTFCMDLSGLAYDQTSNTVSGSMNMQAHTGGTVLKADSTIQY